MFCVGAVARNLFAKPQSLGFESQVWNNSFCFIDLKSVLWESRLMIRSLVSVSKPRFFFGVGWGEVGEGVGRDLD